MQPYVFNTYYAPGARDLGGWRVPTENLDRSRQWLQGRGNRILLAQPYRQDPSQSNILFEDPTNKTIDFLSNQPSATLNVNEVGAGLEENSLGQLYTARHQGTQDYLNRLAIEPTQRLQKHQAKQQSMLSPQAQNFVDPSNYPKEVNRRIGYDYEQSLKKLEQSANYQDSSYSAFERMKKMAAGMNIPIESMPSEKYVDQYGILYDLDPLSTKPIDRVFWNHGYPEGNRPIVFSTEAVKKPNYSLNRQLASSLADKLLIEGNRAEYIDPFVHSIQPTPRNPLNFGHYPTEAIFESPDYQLIRRALTHGIMRQAAPDNPDWAKTSYFDTLRRSPNSFGQIIEQPMWSSQLRNLGNYAGRLLM